jgi:hypothetical protein
LVARADKPRVAHRGRAVQQDNARDAYAGSCSKRSPLAWQSARIRR